GQPLAGGSAGGGVGVDDQLGAAAQGAVGGRVHVAEDQVGLQPRLEGAVGAAVDGDDQRSHVADVGAQRFQVAAVAVAADDDQDVAGAGGGPGGRGGGRAGGGVGLLGGGRQPGFCGIRADPVVPGARGGGGG